MGIYVNNKTAYTLYKSETVKPYFIDKTRMLKELFPLVEEGNNYLCITRPRRFGKTVMANMIASFFPEGEMQKIYLKPCRFIRKRITGNTGINTQ